MPIGRTRDQATDDENVRMFVSSAAMETEIIAKPTNDGTISKRMELEREYSEETKRKHEKIIRRLLQEFDLEKTKDKYRSGDIIEYKANAVGLEHSKFREELIRLMGSDVIRLNDREWNERFHRRIEEEYHRTLDQKEKALAEAEEKRIRKLKLEGLVPMSDDSDNDRFHHKPSANNRKKRLTKSHKKQKKNSQQISGHSYDNHQNIYRPTEDVCTQIEVVYQKEPVPSESSEECIPNKSRSPSAVSERNNSVIGLYSMAEKLVLR
ncbi:hypothetical protein SNE40_001316 [Patella caerulea]|uniref:Uncharacterized protein n=1 Tax=Patella caerulea TaxID=87958 RepID=A0AAN8KNE7_PATCE